MGNDNLLGVRLCLRRTFIAQAVERLAVARIPPAILTTVTIITDALTTTMNPRTPFSGTVVATVQM